MASSYIAPFLEGSGVAATAASSSAGVMAHSLVALSGGGEGLCGGTDTNGAVLALRTKRQLRRHRAANAFTGVVATASLITSAVAMYLSQFWLVYLAFSVPLCFTAPLALVQRYRLRGLSTKQLLRKTIQIIRNDAIRIQQLNYQFTCELNRLEMERTRLQNVERRLEEIVRSRGEDMRELKRLIRENGKIQKQMKRLNAAAELQQLMCLMLNSDADQDFKLTEKEFEVMLLRLKAFSVVDQNRLRNVFQAASSKSFQKVFNEVAHNLIEAEEARTGETLDAFDYLPWED